MESLEPSRMADAPNPRLAPSILLCPSGHGTPRHPHSERTHGRVCEVNWLPVQETFILLCSPLADYWCRKSMNSQFRRILGNVARYDDVNMDSDVSSISMSINNGLIAQLLSIQRLPTQSRFKSHSSTRPPQTPAASS